MTDLKLYLNVPYAEKDQAKALGARWDAARKKWYVPSGKAAETFARWKPESLPGGDQNSTSAVVSKPAKSEALLTVAVTQALDKNFVPYEGDEPPWD